MTCMPTYWLAYMTYVPYRAHACMASPPGAGGGGAALGAPIDYRSSSTTYWAAVFGGIRRRHYPTTHYPTHPPSQQPFQNRHDHSGSPAALLPGTCIHPSTWYRVDFLLTMPLILRPPTVRFHHGFRSSRGIPRGIILTETRCKLLRLTS